MNSLAAMRLIRQIQYPDPPPAPERKPRAPRKPKAEVIEHIEAESHNSDSGSESSTYDDFPEVEEIQQRFKDAPCEFVSPAGLSKAKTKKEAVKYLEEKACPKIPDLKKKMSSPVAPTPSTAPAKKEKKVKAAPEPVLPPTQSPEVVLAAPPKKAKKVTAKKEDLPAAAPAQGTPLAPSEPAAKKPKRAASAYALAVGRHRKAGLSFGDAAKAAKAEIDAKKKN